MSTTALTRSHPVVRLSAERLALGTITIVGLALRLIAIDSRGLWSDEAWRVYAARLPSVPDVVHVAWAQPPSAPLYWVGLHWWIALFGHGDVAVRLFSVPAAVGAIPVTYWLGKLAAGRVTGVVAAGLLAVSPIAVEVGQEATMYAWSMLLATLAVAAGIAWLKSGRGALLYVALATVLLYTHYMGALLLAQLFIGGMLWHFRPRLWGDPPVTTGKSWLLAHVAIAVLWAPWLVAMSLRIAERWGELSQLQHRAGWDELYGSAVNLSVAASAAATWPPAGVTQAVVIGCALLLLALVASHRPERRTVWLLASLVLGFVGVIMGTSALTGAWLVQPRFLTLVLPVMLVVLAASLPVAEVRQRRLAPLVLVAGLLMVGWIVAQVNGTKTFYTNPVHGHEGPREMGAWLSSSVEPGDIVASNHPLLLWSLAQYYDGPTQGLPESQDVRQGYRLWPPPDQLKLADPQWTALSRQAANANRIWLLYLPVMDPGDLLMGKMKQHFRLIETRNYPLANLYLFAAPHAP